MGLKKCRNCNLMHPSAKRTCSCGYQFEIKSKKLIPNFAQLMNPIQNPGAHHLGNGSQAYTDLIMQQQQVLKHLAQQNGPLTTSAAAAVASLIQVTSAALTANESQASSAAKLLDERKESMRKDRVKEEELMSIVDSVSNMQSSANVVSNGSHDTMDPGLSPTSTFAKNENSPELNENLEAATGDSFGEDSIDNSEDFGRDSMELNDIPVDLTSQCQEAVDSYMKLVGDNGGDFDNNTVTVMQQAPGDPTSGGFTNGSSNASGNKTTPQGVQGLYKRRGRPPGSGWAKQQLRAMMMSDSLINDGDCSLPTMVPSLTSQGSPGRLPSIKFPNNSAAGFLAGSVKRVPPSGGRPRGRPKGSVNRMTSARDYLEFHRAYNLLRQQIRVNKIRDNFKSIAPGSCNNASTAVSTASANTPGTSTGTDAQISFDHLQNPPNLFPNPPESFNTNGSESEMLLGDETSSTDETSSANYVSIDVGGQVFCTSPSTILSYPDSKLYSLTLGAVESNSDNFRQCFFIDRDPSTFQHVLNFARTGQLCLPNDFNNFDLFCIEAKFYDLSGLDEEIERLRPNFEKKFASSKIDGESSRYILVDWFRSSRKLEISGCRSTISRIFRIDTAVLEDAIDNPHLENFPLSEAAKSLAVTQAVDKVLSFGSYKLFKVSTTNVGNDIMTSYHFVDQ